jgi:hypothetical protein
MVGFDEYDRKARLTPGLLAIAPLTILIVALGLKEYPAVAALGGVIVAAGGAYVLAVLVRARGRKAQPALWDSWGGPPTTIWLRNRENTTNEVLRTRRRSAIERVTGVTLLSAEEEAASPERADDTIEAAVGEVLCFGQDDKYPLVKKENAQYGFERNLYGSRSLGRTNAAVCVLVLIGAAIWPSALHTTRSSAVAALAVDAAFLLGWWLVPSKSRIRDAAQNYSKELLQAVTDRARELETGA